MSDSEIRKIVDSICQNESRTILAGMDIKDINSNRAKIRSDFTNKLAEDLFPFGLKIDNINVEEVKDKEGNKYFFNIRQKELAVVDNQRLIDVAEQTRIGVSGAKEREVKMRKDVADKETDAFIVETQKEQEREESKMRLA